jgi:5-methylcytosine-specific restriction endonuclease McrA
MEYTYGQCKMPHCKRLRPYLSKDYCHTHLARLKRNGTLLTQKEMGIKYNTKLGKLTQDQLNFIEHNSDRMKDTEMAKILNLPQYSVQYARRKVWGRKYKGYNKRTYLKLKFREYKKNCCEVCGWNEAPCDIHHIIPLSEGGSDVFENYICLCPNHHRIRHYQEMEKKKH